MQVTRQIPWARILIEGAAIVASILLAFWIDAWWGGRQERQEERQYLIALKSDFEQTRRNLERSIESHRQASKQVLELLEIVKGPRDSLSNSELVSYMSAVFTMDYPTVVTGTYRDMVNSGDLRLIQSDELRLKLADFEGVWDAYRENVVEEVWDQWNLIQVPYLMPHIEVVSLYPDGYRGFAFPGEVDPIDRDQLWNLEFQNLLSVAVIGDVDMILQGQELLEIVYKILMLLEEVAQGIS